MAIPAAWRGKSITLRIGGAHRYTTLFVNGRKIGEHRGFSAPFSFDVTDAVRPGEDNVIALRIENPGAVPLEGPREQKPLHPTGMLNYIGNWGGIYGSVELQATDPTWIEQRLRAARTSSASVATFVVTRAKPRDAARLPARCRSRSAPRQRGPGAECRSPAGGRAEVEGRRGRCPMRACGRPSSRISTPPRSRCEQGRRARDRVEERFGMRQLQTHGNVLLLNGKPLYLRGYGDDNIEVLTRLPAIVARGVSSSGSARRAPSASTPCASTR